MEQDQQIASQRKVRRRYKCYKQSKEGAQEPQRPRFACTQRSFRAEKSQKSQGGLKPRVYEGLPAFPLLFSAALHNRRNMGLSASRSGSGLHKLTASASIFAHWQQCVPNSDNGSDSNNPLAAVAAWANRFYPAFSFRPSPFFLLWLPSFWLHLLLDLPRLFHWHFNLFSFYDCTLVILHVALANHFTQKYQNNA